MSSAVAADVKVPGATKAKFLKAPPLPPPPTWFFSAEGGAACSGSNIAAHSRFVPGVDLGHVGNACGWTARVGFGQEHTALFGGMADYWGVFVRYTRIQDSAPGHIRNIFSRIHKSLFLQFQCEHRIRRAANRYRFRGGTGYWHRRR